MSKNQCQFLTTEYQSQYVEKQQCKVPINRPRDVFAEKIDESWQIDPLEASKISEINEDAKNRAHRLILDTLKSVYTTDFTHPAWRGADSKSGRGGARGGGGRDTSDLGSELLTYISDLFRNTESEKVLAPPATAKRVFGYMRPARFHKVLSDYQDGYGRTGGIVMTRNAELVETSSRKEALRKRKFGSHQETDDPCSPERLVEMHFN